MRVMLKIVVGVAIIIVLAVGLLPPLFARGTLDTDALNAAKAGASALSVSGASPAAAQAAVEHSLAGSPDVTLIAIKVNPDGQVDTVQVTLGRTVHTFMDGIPGLKGWFHVRSTQESSLGA